MSDASNKPRFIDSKRRGFLQGATVAGGAVAAGGSLANTPGRELLTEPVPVAKQSKGYELTDHVKKYYKRARF
ncbi:MAG: twin-arginine translocation signal domain-containing protein [Granulosicoccus sp.]|nr:twin-arginine translocation signal domain-containing protein [Granulosicoccus sp.]